MSRNISKYRKNIAYMVKNKEVLKNRVIWSLIILLFISTLAIYNFLLMPTINLKGSRFIEIGYNEQYKELGYEAKFMNKNVTNDVIVKGKVNEKKLGTYDITYLIKIGTLKKKVVRKVSVIDNKKPVINIDNSDIYACPGEDYFVGDFEAIDDYDGDVTSLVNVNKDKNMVTYSVSDKHGNKTEVKRNVIYKDKYGPTIELKGQKVVYAFVGDNYNEPGYKANDNCDGDITDKVVVSGSVNTSKVGQYNITYSVKDAANNSFEVSRKVIVSEKGGNGTIYLTFDDGPKNGTTNVILDVLKEEGVKATFFVTNSGPDDLIKREFNEGHTVALHTASHNYAQIYSSQEAYFNDLNIVSERVKRITGTETKIIRFPGGSSNTISRRYCSGIMSTLTGEVVNRGYHYFDWNISSGDAEYGDHAPEEIYNNVVNSLSHDRINVVLMHDIKGYTRDALKSIIHYGKENGYSFDKITMTTPMVKQKVNN